MTTYVLVPGACHGAAADRVPLASLMQPIRRTGELSRFHRRIHA